MSVPCLPMWKESSCAGKEGKAMDEWWLCPQLDPFPDPFIWLPERIALYIAKAHCVLIGCLLSGTKWNDIIAGINAIKYIWTLEKSKSDINSQLFFQEGRC